MAVTQCFGPRPPLLDGRAPGVETRERVEESRVLDPAVPLPPAVHLGSQTVLSAGIVPGSGHKRFGGFQKQRGFCRRGSNVVDALGASAPADAAPSTPRQRFQGFRGVLGTHKPVLYEGVGAQQQRRAA